MQSLVLFARCHIGCQADITAVREQEQVHGTRQKMNKYEVLDKIGEGAHGSVLKARRYQDDKTVAMKKILVRKLGEGLPRSIVREIKCMQALSSPFIMKILDHFPQGSGFVLVFEFMPSGLWEMIHDKRSPLTEPNIKSYMFMLLKGLSYMHHHDIMHRDLKPANLLIAEDGTLKIGDFGQARTIIRDPLDAESVKGGRYTQQVATRWYRAPELLYGSRHYTESIDMWAAGCILVEMFTRVPLFPGETDIDQLALVISKLGSPTEENWPGHTFLPDFNKITFSHAEHQPWSTLLAGLPPSAIQLAKEFIKYDSAKRITPDEALSSAYFKTEPEATPFYDLPKPPVDHRSSIKDDAHFDFSSSSIDIYPGMKYNQPRVAKQKHEL